VASPTLLVLDPKHLASAKDPDAFVRERGVGAWLEVLGKRECAIGWRARDLLVAVTPQSLPLARRDALARAGAWLGLWPYYAWDLAYMAAIPLTATGSRRRHVGRNKQRESMFWLRRLYGPLAALSAAGVLLATGASAGGGAANVELSGLCVVMVDDGAREH
jgi:hypothetical protein